MLLLLIEAGILIALLKTIVDEDISLISAFLLTFVTLVAMNGFVYLFLPLGGIPALLLGGGLTTVGLGAAVSWLYGAPWKTASLVSLVFLVVCVALSLCFQLLFRL